MAIDTDEKKYSSMLIGLPFRMSVPIPSQVGFTEAQRQIMLLQYSGIAWGVAAITSLGVKIVRTLMEGALRMETGMTDVIQLTYEVE